MSAVASRGKRKHECRRACPPQWKRSDLWAGPRGRRPSALRQRTRTTHRRHAKEVTADRPVACAPRRRCAAAAGGAHRPASTRPPRNQSATTPAGAFRLRPSTRLNGQALWAGLTLPQRKSRNPLSPASLGVALWAGLVAFRSADMTETVANIFLRHHQNEIIENRSTSSLTRFWRLTSISTYSGRWSTPP